MTGPWKRIAVVAALAALVAAVAGTINATAGSKASKAGSLHIMGFGKGDDVAQTRTAYALKATGNPSLNNPNGGFNDQQFLAAVASGSPPDLVYLDRQKVGTYAAKGAFQPLNACINSQKIPINQYRKPAIREVTYKGKIYAIPEFYDVRTIIANLDVLKAQKVKLSDLDTRNWAKLKQVTKKLVGLSGGKLTRIGFDPKLPEFFPLWAKANGVDILSANGLKANLNDPKAIAALQYAVSLINIQGGWNKFKAFRDSFDFFGAGNEYAKNQLGAFPMEQWYYNVLASTSPSIKIAARPFRTRTGKVINFETGSGWAIPKGSKNYTLACKWMKAITSVNAWMAAAKNRAKLRRESKQPYTGLSTANTVADSKIFKQTYTGINKYFDQAVKTVLRVQNYSFNIPPSPASAEFQTAWMDAVNRVLAGQQTPKAALNQAQKEAQAAINKAKK